MVGVYEAYFGFCNRSGLGCAGCWIQTAKLTNYCIHPHINSQWLHLHLVSFSYIIRECTKSKSEAQLLPELNSFTVMRRNMWFLWETFFFTMFELCILLVCGAQYMHFKVYFFAWSMHPKLPLKGYHHILKSLQYGIHLWMSVTQDMAYEVSTISAAFSFSCYSFQPFGFLITIDNKTVPFRMKWSRNTIKFNKVPLQDRGAYLRRCAWANPWLLSSMRNWWTTTKAS